MWEILVHTLLMAQSSFSIILDDWYLFFCLLIIPSACAAVINWFLSDIPIDQSSLAILVYLGGFLGFSLFSLCLVLLKVKPSPTLGWIIVGIASLSLISRRRPFYMLITPNVIGLVIFAFFILLLRLIFIQGLIVPPYADSVEHLQIVKDFLNPEHPPQAFYHLSLEPRRYYHLGFHALVAWLSGTTHTAPEHVILLLGQYFQALAVLSIYPLARIVTKNSFSAWTVMCIAGLLLPIPAYASNWGKYPAIASLLGIAFVLVLAVIYIKNTSRISRKFWWLVGIAVFATFCLHSRSLFVFLIVTFLLTLYFRFNVFQKELTMNERNDNKIAVIVILNAALFISIASLKLQISFLFFPLFIGLSILFFYFNFSLASFIVLLVLLMRLSLLFPLSGVFQSNRLNIIFDRPFLVIFLYIPISFLLWGGLNGCVGILNKYKPEVGKQFLFAGILMIGLINAVFFQNHAPSKCCVFIDNDDLFSFEWIKQNIPEDAIVGIAATGISGNLLPADGGAWIESIIGIPTRKLDTKSDFTVKTWKLCYENVTYFYVDNLENSFDEYNLIEAGGIYQFGLGDVRIYHLECNFLK